MRATRGLALSLCMLAGCADPGGTSDLTGDTSIAQASGAGEPLRIERTVEVTQAPELPPLPAVELCTACEVTGGGFLEGDAGKVSFGLSVNGAGGQLELVDHGSRPPLRLHGAVEGPTSCDLFDDDRDGETDRAAAFPRGTLRDGRPFGSTAIDAGEPSTADALSFASDAVGISGPLAGGNVQVRGGGECSAACLCASRSVWFRPFYWDVVQTTVTAASGETTSGAASGTLTVFDFRPDWPYLFSSEITRVIECRVTGETVTYLAVAGTFSLTGEPFVFEIEPAPAPGQPNHFRLIVGGVVGEAIVYCEPFGCCLAVGSSCLPATPAPARARRGTVPSP